MLWVLERTNLGDVTSCDSLSVHGYDVDQKLGSVGTWSEFGLIKRERERERERERVQEDMIIIACIKRTRCNLHKSVTKCKYNINMGYL